MSVISATSDAFGHILCRLIQVLFAASKQQTNVKQTLVWIYIQFCHGSNIPFRHLILNQFKVSLDLLCDDLYDTICPIRASFFQRPREYETVYVRIPFAQLSPFFRLIVKKHLGLFSDPSLSEKRILQDQNEFVFSFDSTILNRSLQDPKNTNICIDLSSIRTPTKIYASSYLDINDVTHVFMDRMYQLMIELRLQGIVTMDCHKKVSSESNIDKVCLKR